MKSTCIKKGHRLVAFFYCLFSWLGRTLYLIKSTTAHVIEVREKCLFARENDDPLLIHSTQNQITRLASFDTVVKDNTQLA